MWGDIFLAECQGHIENGLLFFCQSEIHVLSSHARNENSRLFTCQILQEFCKCGNQVRERGSQVTNDTPEH